MTSSSRGGEPMSGGVRSHAVQLGVPAAVMRKPFCGPSSLAVVGLDEPVALEALERRVHLPDVQRPHLAGPRLELLAQLQPVLRPLAQQREQGVADAHRGCSGVYIPGSIRSILAPATRASNHGRAGRTRAVATKLSPAAHCWRSQL